MNKKASEKILSIWLLIFMFLSAGSLSFLLYYYMNQEINIQYTESATLYEKISDCISANGNLKNEIFADDFDIFNFCHLKKNILDSEYFYINLTIYFSAQQKSFVFGNTLFEVGCNLPQSEKKLECFKAKDSYFFSNLNSYGKANVSILTASANSMGASYE